MCRVATPQQDMRDNPSAAFVWLTPGKGELEEQSKAKMDRYCHNASTKTLADVMAGGFAAGDAVFVNWEKLKLGANALKDSERTNFVEWVAEVGAGCGLPYEDCRKVMFRLFGADGGGVLSLGVKELYAFVINNAQALKEDFREAMRDRAGSVPSAEMCESDRAWMSLRITPTSP